MRSAERREKAEKRGRLGEALAAWFLRCKFYRILGKRVRTRAGEIDLIALSPAGVLCFVEVKTRPDEALAAGAVGMRQRARIVRAAELYLAGRAAALAGRGPRAGRAAAKGVRFDVISIAPGSLPRHFRDAWRPDAL